jgi:hypothetical protein
MCFRILRALHGFVARSSYLVLLWRVFETMCDQIALNRIQYSACLTHSFLGVFMRGLPSSQWVPCIDCPVC